MKVTKVNGYMLNGSKVLYYTVSELINVDGRINDGFFERIKRTADSYGLWALVDDKNVLKFLKKKFPPGLYYTIFMKKEGQSGTGTVFSYEIHQIEISLKGGRKSIKKTIMNMGDNVKESVEWIYCKLV